MTDAEKKRTQERKRKLALPVWDIAKNELQALVENGSDGVILNETSINKEEDFLLVCMMIEHVDEGITTKYRTVYDRCKYCHALFRNSDGGQQARHIRDRCKSYREKVLQSSQISSSVDDPTNRKITDFTLNKLSKEVSNGIVAAMSTYCMRAAKSYRSLASPAFRDYTHAILKLGDARYSHPKITDQFPSDNTIARNSRIMFEKVMQNVHRKVVDNIANGVTICTDFGNLKESHFSLYISFLTVVDLKWKSYILPLGFKASFNPKTTEEVYRLVREILFPYGFTKEQLRECYYCGDGASYNRTAGKDREKFKDFIRCINHGINLIFERALKPYKDAKLDVATQETLKSVTELISNCRTLAYALKANRKIAGEVKLPNPGAETRWMSFYNCVSETLQFFNVLQDIEHLLSGSLKDKIDRLQEQDNQLKTVVYVFRLLPEWMITFQGTGILTHLCLPCLKLLINEFETMCENAAAICKKEGLDVQFLEALSQSALHASRKIYKELAEPHFAAVLLSPKSKQMQFFEREEKQMATEYVEEELKKLADSRAPSVPAPSRCPFEDNYNGNQVTSSELTRYLAEEVHMSESIESYWPSRQATYPSLYKVASLVFSVIPSESVCERAFSRSNYIIDKSRLSLNVSNIEDIVIGATLLDAYPEFL